MHICDIEKSRASGLPLDSVPMNDTPIAIILKLLLYCYIKVEAPVLLSVPLLVKVLVQIVVDLDAPSYPCMISTMLGEFQILEVTLPQLTFPAVPVSSRVLEEVSRVSDLLVDLVAIALLASMSVSTPIVSTSLYSSTSAISYVSIPILPSTILPAAIE